MTAPAPRVRASAVLFKIQPPHGRIAHYEIEWRGPVGVARSGHWYFSYEDAHAMAEECGAVEIVDG